MELPVLNEKPASGGGCSASSCGTSDDQLGHLSDEIRAKVENHPCYSTDRLFNHTRPTDNG